MEDVGFGGGVRQSLLELMHLEPMVAKGYIGAGEYRAALQSYLEGWLPGPGALVPAEASGLAAAPGFWNRVLGRAYSECEVRTMLWSLLAESTQEEWAFERDTVAIDAVLMRIAQEAAQIDAELSDYRNHGGHWRELTQKAREDYGDLLRMCLRALGLANSVSETHEQPKAGAGGAPALPSDEASVPPASQR